MKSSQLIIVRSIGILFIFTYVLIMHKTYTYYVEVKNLREVEITNSGALKSKIFPLLSTPLLDSVATGEILWAPSDRVLSQRVADDLSTKRSEKMATLVLNGSLAFFFFFSGFAFLSIWLRTNAIINESPEFTRTPLKPFFSVKKRDDLTMIFLSLAILIWLLSNLVTLHFHRVSHERLFFSSLLSSLNSAFFLAASIDFDYHKRPKWLKWRLIDRWFQRYDGILYIFLLVIAVSIPLNLMDKNPNAGFNSAYVADFIFSLFAISVVGHGLYDLFKNRLNMEMGLMVILSMSLVFITQIAIIVPQLLSIISPDSHFFISNLLGVGYKTTLVTLFLILVITWATRQMEKNNRYYMDRMKEKIVELDLQNSELSRINAERDAINNELTKINIEREEINKELLKRKNEIAHRVKNSLSILLNFVQSRIGLYAHDPQHSTYLELWKISVRSEGILMVHEFLDKKHSDESINEDYNQEIMANKVNDKVMLKLFLEDLLSRLERAFGYEVGNFRYDFSRIDEFLAAKRGIAKDIAMAITELAINVNQHAYPNGEEKKIQVTGYKNAESLIIKVEDEGIGGTGMTMKFEKGHGRAIIDTIVSQHEARISSTSVDSRGFTAILEFPIKNLNIKK